MFKTASLLKAGQRGFSLIELMISMLIAGIILAGVVKVAFNAKRSSFDGEQLAFIQDNARFVLDLIKRDVRISGYSGCASVTSANKSTAVVDDLDGFINIKEALRGFEGSVGDHPDEYDADVAGETDSFIVRFADPTHEMMVRSHNVTAGTFTLWDATTIDTGATLLVADANCREVGIFHATGPGSSSTQLEHAADGSRNCTRVIRASSQEISCASASCGAASCDSNPEKDYQSGSVIMPYNAHAYYVGESAVMPGILALKRQVLTTSGGNATTETEEIALGVEDLQVLYGVDSDDDSEANQFVGADLVTNWGEVVAMRVTLVFRSDREVYATDQNVELTLDGDNYTLSDDRFMRQVVTTSIRIRNN